MLFSFLIAGLLLVYRAMSHEKVYPKFDIDKQKFSIQKKRGNQNKPRSIKSLKHLDKREKYGEV